jgi:hypothetical protein
MALEELYMLMLSRSQHLLFCIREGAISMTTKGLQGTKKSEYILKHAPNKSVLSPTVPLRF